MPNAHSAFDDADDPTQWGKNDGLDLTFIAGSSEHLPCFTRSLQLV